MEGLNLRPLSPIDLERCATVSEIVAALSGCSFGARMLGTVTKTIETAIRESERPFIVYDGEKGTALHELLDVMCRNGWFREIDTPDQYVQSQLVTPDSLAVVIGHYPERLAKRLQRKARRTIYINKEGQSDPTGEKEGYYPDRVFLDPEFVLPVICHSLLERLNGILCSVSEFIANLDGFGGVAKETAAGARTFSAMVNDPDCKVFLTLTGAMTIAKMGLILDHLVSSGMVQFVSSTGALLSHGAIESIGLKHYAHDPSVSDPDLRDRGLNRVTDTIEPETNFDHLEEVLDAVFQECAALGRPIGSIEFHRMVGRYILEKYPGHRGIFPAACRMNVPIMVPAFIDSETANDLYTFNLDRMRNDLEPLLIVPELDTRILVSEALGAKRMGILSVGGGAPRNNIQNAACLIDLISRRLGLEYGPRMFSYGVRIDPGSVYLGHLSGCTYQEGKSWGKFQPDAETAEIRSDATAILPFIVRYAMDNRHQ